MNVVLVVPAAALVGLLLLSVPVVYNRLVRRRNAADNAWAQIDVQLRLRHDLVPSLVNTVKGYAAHERGTFEAVTNARAGAINAQGPAQQAQAENVLTGALKSLFAVAEAYPDLKANQNFLDLSERVTQIEGAVAESRQFYNDAVLTYNNAMETFPGRLLARGFGFSARDYFRENEPDVREPVTVQF